MNHIERVIRTIEFNNPDILPYELNDVPGVYDAYATIDPTKLKQIPGTEDCDSIRVTYHWTFLKKDKNPSGEEIRRDEWGCLHRIPNDTDVAYEIIEKPLIDPLSFNSYKFPNPDITDYFFERIEKKLEPYRDRFICAYIDPGPFLIAFNLMGYEGLFFRLKDDLQQVEDLIAGIIEYQKCIIEKWNKIGVHMLAMIDELAGTTGMMFSPQLWRDRFKKYYIDFFSLAKKYGLYTSLYLDGNISAIFDDLQDLPLDMLESLQPNATGIKKWSYKFKGIKCLKASADFMTTLSGRDMDKLDKEIRSLFDLYSTPDGGFMPVVVRWHRPAFNEETVVASVKSIQRYRREWAKKCNKTS